MRRPKSRERAPRALPKPLDSARLEELALAYVARFATSAAKLEGYLQRKLRERGWVGDGENAGEPPVAGMVERLVAAGYIDDTAYARAKSGSLLRRGYGERRVTQALSAAGIAKEVRTEVRASEGAARRAALALARKRRLGPFGAERPDRALREKQLAALLRAGHPMDSARILVDARDMAAAEDWAAAGEEEDNGCE
jgi:regulatory protein